VYKTRGYTTQVLKPLDKMQISFKARISYFYDLLRLEGNRRAPGNMHIDYSKTLISSPNPMQLPLKTILMSGNSIGFGEEMWHYVSKLILRMLIWSPSEISYFYARTWLDLFVTD